MFSISKLIISIIFALSTIIGKDIKNKRLVSAKSTLDNEFEKWAEKSMNSKIDFTTESIKSYLIFTFIILALILTFLSVIFGDSLFVKNLSLEAGSILLISMFGLKTVGEFETSTKNYIDWIFKYGIFIGACGTTIYIFYNTFILNLTSNDIAQNEKLLEPFFETGITYFFAITLAIYLFLILLPFLTSYIFSSYVRFIIKRSLKLEGNTFNHFARYYGYTFLLISIIIILTRLFIEPK